MKRYMHDVTMQAILKKYEEATADIVPDMTIDEELSMMHAKILLRNRGGNIVV